MELFNLQGEVAVITGGNGGIGLGMAKGIASLGCAVVIAGRNEAKAATALAELRAMGVGAAFVTADVTSKADCQALVASVGKPLHVVDC
jgi:2-dehydro-3-deoxy-D-gluconate 5-dehydrogenase